MRRRAFLLSTGPVALAAIRPQAAVAAEEEECVALLSRRRDEAQLQNRRLAPPLWDGLGLWDDKLQKWRQQPPGHVVMHARIALLHLWADWCKPCRAEFPWLRDLARELPVRYKGKVQLVLISETTSADAMQAFVQQNRAALPAGPQYLDALGALAQLIRGGLPSGNLSLPITLLCDEQAVVRQAFIGPLTARHEELHQAVDRLVAALAPYPRP